VSGGLELQWTRGKSVRFARLPMRFCFGAQLNGRGVSVGTSNLVAK